MAMYIMQRLGLDKMVGLNTTKLAMFLGEIYKGYRRDVEYHNDMHAADVLQVTHFFLTKGKVIDITEANELDLISVVIAAVCHDFKHDGLNNSYHINAISDRAIRFNDQAVQENYHASEAFQILN